MGQASREWREEQLTDQFHRWEVRGRGWKVWEAPVVLEPPFIPFRGYALPQTAVRDDGRKHTFASGILERLRQRAGPPAVPQAAVDAPEEPEPRCQKDRPWQELQLSLPNTRSIPTSQVEVFLRQICRTGEPLALEILGTERETFPQFVVSPQAGAKVKNAVETNFPGIICVAGDSSRAVDAISTAWSDSESSFAVVEMGLGRESMLPLGNPRCDMLAAVVSAMDTLGKGEFGLLQILFEPVRAAWGESMMRAVMNDQGASFFTGRDDLLRGAEQKNASPLFAVVLRLVSCASHRDRAWELIADMAAPLSALARPGTNYLIPLHNEEYPAANHEEDILGRLSRRSGILLTMEELIPFLLPPVTATSRKLRRETKATNSAPEMLLQEEALYLGTNTHAGVSREVSVSPEHRVRHIHVIGGTGRGKSTFLRALIKQDIEQGEGVAVFDPHGDLADEVLGFIPPERVDDVVVIDPSDEQFPVGLNILAAHSDFERGLLASDLVAVFRRLSTSWGDQMESVLRNAIVAFLESSRGGTLADLRRFLLDAAFRKDFLQTVTDPEIVFYWERAFPQLTGGKSIGPLLTRLDEFLARKPIRHMVSQNTNRVDFADIIDRGRILIVKLPQGLIGRENSALLGSLIIAKLQIAAMSRQRLPAAERRDFWCYMDEFQQFITPSMAEILMGARKYRLGLILAHQDLHQLDSDRDVASAVLSNCYTRVVFAVSDSDARTFEQGFSHFEARDLMNLPIGEAVCRVERSDFDFNLEIPPPEAVDDQTSAESREAVVEASRSRYASPRAEVEADLLRKWQPVEPKAKKAEAVIAPDPAESESPAAVSEPPPSSSPEGRSAETASAPAAPTDAPPDARRSIPELGIGGSEHQEIQRLIKERAHELGFKGIRERVVLEGAGKVDVSLEDELRLIVACEISITTTPQQELANIRKCLEAGYENVVAVAPQRQRLVNLAAVFKQNLTPEEAGRVHVCLPGGLSSLLKRLLRRARPSDAGTRKAGYKIKRKYAEAASNEQAQEAEKEALRTVARILRGER